VIKGRYRPFQQCQRGNSVLEKILEEQIALTVILQ
jgi:hypothetical protein